jgi:hypothetical protein
VVVETSNLPRDKLDGVNVARASAINGQNIDFPSTPIDVQIDLRNEQLSYQKRLNGILRPAEIVLTLKFLKFIHFSTPRLLTTCRHFLPKLQTAMHL